MIMSQNQEYLKCPFCENRCIEAKPGKTKCPECESEFEIDDRLECIFADAGKIRLPAIGIVCRVCGLIQDNDGQNCLYCGIEITTTRH
jgi:hypothetical protein